MVFAHLSISWPLMVLFPSMHTLWIEAHRSVNTVGGKGQLCSFGNHHLREIWRFEGGDQCSDVDGSDGDDDAGQEDGGQFVDVLHAHEDEQGHQE